MADEDQVKELQSEVERLREHNEKLLNEKKAATAQATKLEGERDKLAGEIERRDEAPITDVFESLAAREGFGRYIRAEFERQYQIGKDDDGALVIQDHNGQPVEHDGDTARFDADTIRQLNMAGSLPGLDALILAPQNSGGGASSGTDRAPSQPKQRQPERLQFGLK